MVHDRVRAQMFEVYRSTGVPAFADATAQTLLAEGRIAFAAAGLAQHRVVERGNSCLVFPWVGDRAMNTMSLLLARDRIEVEDQGIALGVKLSRRELLAHFADMLKCGIPDAVTLASSLKAKEIGKYGALLPDGMLSEDFASQRLDVDSARRAIVAITDAYSG